MLLCLLLLLLLLRWWWKCCSCCRSCCMIGLWELPSVTHNFAQLQRQESMQHTVVMLHLFVRCLHLVAIVVKWMCSMHFGRLVCGGDGNSNANRLATRNRQQQHLVVLLFIELLLVQNFFLYTFYNHHLKRTPKVGAVFNVFPINCNLSLKWF